MKKILFALFFVLMLSILCADSFYPTTVSSMDSEVTLHGYGRIRNLKEGEEVNFQTLTFPKSSFQDIEVVREVLYINGTTIYPTYIIDEFENKYVNFKITENGDFNYELVANVKTNALMYEMKDFQIGDFPENTKRFIERSDNVESNSTEIISLTKNTIFGDSFLDVLQKTITWVNDYVEYASGSDFDKYYLEQKSAVQTLIERKGVCDEFSNLAAAILRAKGIPTRLVIGITFDGLEWGNHAWIEVYHKEYGWIPSDPTFREVGFVDATHIRMGSFSDVSLSLAKATYPSTASIIFQTQTLPIIDIKEKDYFSEVSLSITQSELKAREWNDIELTVKNNTNNELIVPVKIIDNYKELSVQENTKTITLKANESGKIKFTIYPNIILQENEYATGKLFFHTLSSPYSKDFKIVYSPGNDNGKVQILDTVPIITNESMKIITTIGNYSAKEVKVNIRITANDYNVEYDENIPAFSEKEIEKEITNSQEEIYTLIIDTPTEQYTRQFYPYQEEFTATTLPTETVIIQKIDTNKKGTNPSGFANIEVLLLAALFGVAVITFGILLVKKRYI